MAKVPVTISIRQEDLLQLDAFAGERRLTRGDAVGVLLEAHAGTLGGIRLDDPDYVPPPPNRTKLDRGREALARATAKTGAAPVAIVGDEVVKGVDESPWVAPDPPKPRDPFDQSPEWDDSYAQDPPQDDVDQRRKGRR